MAKPKRSKKSTAKKATTKAAAARICLAGLAIASVKLVTITKKMAERILTTQAYARQRPTRSSTIGYLVYALRTEMFIPGTLLAFAVGKGIKETLVNGVHRLKALIAHGGKAQFTVIKYLCKNEQMMHDLYTGFDNGVGKRYAHDMYVAHAGMATVDEVGRERVNRMISAVKFIADRFSQGIAKIQTHNTLLYCGVADHFIRPMSDMLKLMAGSMYELNDTTLLKQPILAVALATLKYNRKKAIEFWHAVAHNGVVRIDDARYVFRRFLIDHMQAVQERKPNGSRATATPRQQAFIAAYCYEQYCKGARLHGIDLSTIDKRGPVFIANTPLSKNSTPARVKRAFMELGLSEEHFTHVKEAVRLSATHYNTKLKVKRSKSRKAKSTVEDTVEVDVSVRHKRKTG